MKQTPMRCPSISLQAPVYADLIKRISVTSFWVLACLLLALQPARAQLQFVDRAAELGIVHHYGKGWAGGGVSFADFNGDGLDDLTLASQEGAPPAFFLNTPDGFQRIAPLIDNLDEVKQILWADLDNDGDRDLFLTTVGGSNHLYEHTGNLQLTDITAAAGLSTEAIDSYGACIADFDRDGWLDIYVTERNISFRTNRNYLYHNNGDGTFTEVAESWNALVDSKPPFCPVAFDLNNDRWPDLYIAQDRVNGNDLLRNDGNRHFSNISFSSGTGVRMNAMGIGVGDYNRDGFQDLYISNTPQGNAFFHNNGDETFQEVAHLNGTRYYGTGWACQFFDADNDGWEDLYVSGQGTGTPIVPSLFYRNDRQGGFYTPQAGFQGDTLPSYGHALGDYNLDGNLDIAVINGDSFPVQLWSNPDPTGHFLQVRPEGVASNRDAIGARLEAYCADTLLLRYRHCGLGFLGQNGSFLHFGLGANQVVDSLLIYWPSGHLDRLTDIPADQQLTIREGQTTGGTIYIDPRTQTPTHYSERQERLRLALFPNPASEVVRLRGLPGEAVTTVRIHDSSGKLLLETTIRQETDPELRLPQMTPGIYLISGRGKRYFFREKLILK